MALNADVTFESNLGNVGSDAVFAQPDVTAFRRGMSFNRGGNGTPGTVASGAAGGTTTVLCLSSDASLILAMGGAEGAASGGSGGHGGHVTTAGVSAFGTKGGGPKGVMVLVSRPMFILTPFRSANS